MKMKKFFFSIKEFILIFIGSIIYALSTVLFIFPKSLLLGACWDTAHGNIDTLSRDIGQYKNIIDIGDKLKGLHISDNFGDTHHHSWPFAGIINFDSVMQGLLDVNYDGYFTFEASYTLLHQKNLPYSRQEWHHNGEVVTKLLNPSVELKKKSIDLLYETGRHILETYNCFEN